MSDWSEGNFSGSDSGGFLSGLFGGGSSVIPGMSMIPSLTGGAGGASGDATTKGGTVGGAAFDNSGWNVTFGANSAIESSRSQAAALQGYMPYVLGGGAILLGLVWLKRRKQ